MEDSHIAHLDLLKGIHLFAVFDGHGGKQEFFSLQPFLWPGSLRRTQIRALWLKVTSVEQFSNLSLLGHEVAMFCQKHMGPELLKQEAFKKGDYGKALKETFLLLDKMMRTTSGKEQLHKFSKQSPIPKK